MNKIKRLLTVVMAAMLINSIAATPVSARQFVAATNITAVSTGTSDCASTNCLSIPVSGVPSVGFGVSGTSSATLVPEASTDGIRWFTIQMVNAADGTVTSSITAAGQYNVNNPGFVAIRLRATVYTSGVFNVAGTRGSSNSSSRVSTPIVPVSGCIQFGTDTWLQRQAAGNLGISGASCGGAASGTISVGTVTYSGGQSIIGTTANITTLQNGTTAQEFRVFGNTTGSKYASIAHNGNNTTITTTGTASALNLYANGGGIVMGGSVANQWTITSAGVFGGFSDNAVDIGTSSVNRPRTGYFGTSVQVGSNVTVNIFGFVAASNGAFIVTSRGGMQGGSANGIMQFGNATLASGVAVDFTTNSTAWFKTLAEGDTAIVKANGAQFTGLASSTGVRYVCAGTTGILDGQVAACVGTDAEAIASIPELRHQIDILTAQVVALSSVYKFSPFVTR